METFAPREHKSFAVSIPIPEAPPVIAIAFPWKEDMLASGLVDDGLLNVRVGESYIAAGQIVGL